VYTPDLLEQGSEVSVDDSTGGAATTTTTDDSMDGDFADDGSSTGSSSSSDDATGSSTTDSTASDDDATSDDDSVPVAPPVQGDDGATTTGDATAGTATAGGQTGQTGGAVVPPGTGSETADDTDVTADDDTAAADDSASTADDSADTASAADDTTASAAEDDAAVEDSMPVDQNGPSEDPLIDDFEDGNAQIRTRGLREGYWFTATDGDSDGTITDIDDVFVDLPDGSGGAAHIVASGFDLESPAGVFGVNLNDDDSDPYLQSAQYDGLAFFACSPAGSQRIIVEITTTDTVKAYNHYRATVRLTDMWQAFSFEWDDFSQTWGDMVAFDPEKVVGLQFNLDADTDPDTLEGYDLWLDDIEFIEDGSTSASGPSGACPGSGATADPEPMGDAGAP
jgi:hypothetical protein